MIPLSTIGKVVEFGFQAHYALSSSMDAVDIQKYGGSHAMSQSAQHMVGLAANEAGFAVASMVAASAKVAFGLGTMAAGALTIGLGMGLGIGASMAADAFFEETSLVKSRYSDLGTSTQFGRGTFMDSKGTQKARARHMAMLANGDPNLAASRMQNFAILGQEASYMHY